jgi:hypothetical protein
MIINLWYEFPGTRNQESLCWQGPAAIYQAGSTESWVAVLDAATKQQPVETQQIKKT